MQPGGTSAVPVIGVVHLAPLPGAPRNRLSLSEIIEHALHDARAYQSGGASALIIENFGDAPFYKERVPAHTVAAMAVAAHEVAETVRLPLGINVLRNDAAAALGIAAAVGASFIRVNVHSGVMVTDQGIIEGQADQTLRLRRQLGADAEIWADIAVKHGVPLGAQTLEDAALDAVEREMADALIVTGLGTGRPADPNDLARLRRVLPSVPRYVGSGTTPELIPAFLHNASGFIVGTWAKVGGRIDNPVDPERVRQLVGAASKHRDGSL